MADIELVFPGDVCLGDVPFIELGTPVSETLRRADLVVADQEGSITRVTAFSLSKCYRRSAVESVERLRQSIAGGTPMPLRC